MSSRQNIRGRFSRLLTSLITIIRVSIDFSYSPFPSRFHHATCYASSMRVASKHARRALDYDTHDLRLSERERLFSGALTPRPTWSPVDKDDDRKFRAERDADVFTESSRKNWPLRNDAHTHTRARACGNADRHNTPVIDRERVGWWIFQERICVGEMPPLLFRLMNNRSRFQRAHDLRFRESSIPRVEREVYAACLAIIVASCWDLSLLIERTRGWRRDVSHYRGS